MNKFKMELINAAESSGCREITERVGARMAELASDFSMEGGGPWNLAERHEADREVGTLMRIEPPGAYMLDQCEFVLHRNNNWEPGAYVGRFRLRNVSESGGN